MSTIALFPMQYKSGVYGYAEIARPARYNPYLVMHEVGRMAHNALQRRQVADAIAAGAREEEYLTYHYYGMAGVRRMRRAGGERVSLLDRVLDMVFTR